MLSKLLRTSCASVSCSACVSADVRSPQLAQTHYTPLGAAQQCLADEGVEVLAVRLDQVVQVALALGEEALQVVPRVVDDLELAEALHRPHKVDHLAEQHKRAVRVFVERCESGVSAKTMYCGTAATTHP